MTRSQQRSVSDCDLKQPLLKKEYVASQMTLVGTEDLSRMTKSQW